ncbi:MAG: hypothetical protein H8E36_15250 [Rhodospirillaceae bacterium]|nr:hypothetical protein [Rhodospirillaceae bacterium]
MDIPNIIGRLLCWLGLHDFQVVEKTFGFSDDDNVEKVRCRRCGESYIREA